MHNFGYFIFSVTQLYQIIQSTHKCHDIDGFMVLSQQSENIKLNQILQQNYKKYILFFLQNGD